MGGLNDRQRTEALIAAAQDQSLRTNAWELWELYKRLGSVAGQNASRLV